MASITQQQERDQARAIRSHSNSDSSYRTAADSSGSKISNTKQHGIDHAQARSQNITKEDTKNIQEDTRRHMQAQYGTVRIAQQHTTARIQQKQQRNWHRKAHNHNSSSSYSSNV